MVALHLVWVVKTIELFQVCLVGLLKVALYVGKVYDIAISVVLVWTVHTGEGLQQVMVFELSTEIQAFQAWRIKSCQEHIEDNEQVNGHVLLEVLDDLLASLLVVAVVENQAYSQKFLLGSIHGCGFSSHPYLVAHLDLYGLRLSTIGHVLKGFVKFACLFARLTNDHTAQCVIALNLAELAEVVSYIVRQFADIALMLYDLRTLDVFLLHKRFEFVIHFRQTLLI